MSAGATVRWLRLEDAPPYFEEALSPDERERAAAFRFERDRRRFTIARGFLRTSLGRCLGAEPGGIELAYGRHGKPRLAAGDADLRFNLSHSGGVVALALCHGREVGVDVERVRPGLRTEEIARRYLPRETVREIERLSGEEREREFFRAWVRLEARLKARGAGLGELETAARLGGWPVVDLASPRGYVGALAVEGADPADLRVLPVCRPAGRDARPRRRRPLPSPNTLPRVRTSGCRLR